MGPTPPNPLPRHESQARAAEHLAAISVLKLALRHRPLPRDVLGRLSEAFTGKPEGNPSLKDLQKHAATLKMSAEELASLQVRDWLAG